MTDVFPWHGHLVNILPEKTAKGWEAHAEVVVHSRGTTERINYHDHVTIHATREAAAQASAALGKMAVENFIVPASGEGDHRTQDEA